MNAQHRDGQKGEDHVARRPNYGQERSERQRRKALQREERLAAKAEQREKKRMTNASKAENSAPEDEAPDTGGRSGMRRSD
ncbi:MAG: hypothetical protein AB7S71_01865 [Dongiaceae bacterium]